MKRTSFCLVACFLLPFLAGCGEKGKGLNVEFVQGVVTLDGEVVAGATISFIPVDREGPTETAGGFSGANGVYRITSSNGTPEKGAVAGEYHVTVDKYLTEVIYPPGKEGDPDVETKVATKYFLPDVYREVKTTPLTVTVNKGKNTINLELKSIPR